MCVAHARNAIGARRRTSFASDGVTWPTFRCAGGGVSWASLRLARAIVAGGVPEVYDGFGVIPVSELPL